VAKALLQCTQRVDRAHRPEMALPGRPARATVLRSSAIRCLAWYRQRHRDHRAQCPVLVRRGPAAHSSCTTFGSCGAADSADAGFRQRRVPHEISGVTALIRSICCCWLRSALSAARAVRRQPEALRARSRSCGSMSLPISSPALWVTPCRRIAPVFLHAQDARVQQHART